ncbi:MAG: hypothetical protein ACC608_00705 [Anaerofustis sp.]
MVCDMLMSLIQEYIKCPNGNAEKFSNRYMDMFYNDSKKLGEEVDAEVYDIFDDINWLCDSYENDNAIRKSDPNCIDEQALNEKLNFYIEQLRRSGL